MLSRSNIRLAITGGLIMVVAGAFAGCADSVLGTDDDVDPVCVWINGEIHCED